MPFASRIQVPARAPSPLRKWGIRISVASLILFASVYFGILLAGGSGETIHRDAEEFAKRLEVTEPTSPSPASHSGLPGAPDPGNPDAKPNLGAPAELEKPGMIYRTKMIEMKLVNSPELPLPPGSRIADPNDPPPNLRTTKRVEVIS